MTYLLNDKQNTIIQSAIDKNNDIRGLHDLERTEFYEALINSHEPYISISAVNRKIVFSKCKAKTPEQFAELRKTDEYINYLSWGAGEIELAADMIFTDMYVLKDPEMMTLFLLIHHLARIAREKSLRRSYGKTGPGSEQEFRRALKTAMRFLGIKPEDIRQRNKNIN